MMTPSPLVVICLKICTFVVSKTTFDEYCKEEKAL